MGTNWSLGCCYLPSKLETMNSSTKGTAIDNDQRSYTLFCFTRPSYYLCVCVCVPVCRCPLSASASASVYARSPPLSLYIFSLSFCFLFRCVHLQISLPKMNRLRCFFLHTAISTSRLSFHVPLLACSFSSRVAVYA